VQLVATERVIPGPLTDPMSGRIRWDAAKSLWWWAHLLGAAAAITLYPGWQGVLVFLVLTAATICAGHSTGMHRLLIHRSFRTPRWLEYLLVYLGVLVGMAGPFGMIRAHDLRDWHQRQTRCPPHPAHGAGFWRDGWWQLHCVYVLDHPPAFRIEPEVATSRFYRVVEATWMAQQLPLGLILWAAGGMEWLLWGVSARIFASLTGHWAVGHFAHRTGHQGWRVAGLPVQGYNLPGLGLVAFGENWHGNHHAFPHSARLGVEPGQIDPGFWCIRALEWLGLACEVQLPDSAPPRAGLMRVVPEDLPEPVDTEAELPRVFARFRNGTSTGPHPDPDWKSR
jgi:fatty-acid desaturase